jgi:hypothetical protein
MQRYLFIVAGLLLLLGFALLGEEVRHTALSGTGENASYLDLGGRRTPQIQDEDIFYSNVGNSIVAVRSADVVLLGPSLVGFGIDRDTLQSSAALDHLKIYNMSFIGVRSGEFSRRLIKRWNIHPPLWIINVDDEAEHFFSDNLDLTIGDTKLPILAAERNRMDGYLTVLGRDLKWRLEDLNLAIFGHYFPAGLYRKVSNGDLVLDNNPSYIANVHKPIVLLRDPDCHINPTAVEYARTFLKEAGGNVVLTLVPHSRACVQQAMELAAALNVELITPPFEGITSLDGGGHLDKNGAEKFTAYLAAKLVETRAFKKAFAN